MMHEWGYAEILPDQWNRWNIYLYSKKDLENIYAEKKLMRALIKPCHPDNPNVMVFK